MLDYKKLVIIFLISNFSNFIVKASCAFDPDSSKKRKRELARKHQVTDFSVNGAPTQSESEYDDILKKHLPNERVYYPEIIEELSQCNSFIPWSLYTALHRICNAHNLSDSRKDLLKAAESIVADLKRLN